jgi:carboxypeptidase Taq
VTSADGAFDVVRRRLGVVSDLQGALAVLQWDQQTHMPEAAGAGRAEQIATLSRLVHERITDPGLGRSLEGLARELGVADGSAGSGERSDESLDQALVRVALREHRRATRVPADLVEDLARATSLAEPAWAAARRASDWSRFAPHLERIVELVRRVAEAYGFEEHPLDPLIDLHEPGMTRARLADTFDTLRTALVPMVRAVAEVAEVAEVSEKGDDRDAPLHGTFDEAAQEAFGRSVIERFGYDFKAGRQDRAVHPFCVGIAAGDVRITTRFDESFLSTALFSTLHEAGHALYEQGVAPELARTPLANGASTGVHESQSRLWENLVGRSRPFWRRFYPDLQEAFPNALGAVDGEDFYRAINFVAPTPIRVEADELTYNLHILLRFGIEADLLTGELPVAELPAAWNERTEAVLGIVPEDDAHGVLQDVHWASGAFGYFPTYTVGNVLAAQLYDTAVAERPEIPEEMERGEFGALREWLSENVWRHGARYDPDDLVTRATGRPMETGPYLSYLRTKFGELYEIAP